VLQTLPSARCSVKELLLGGIDVAVCLDTFDADLTSYKNFSIVFASLQKLEITVETGRSVHTGWLRNAAACVQSMVKFSEFLTNLPSLQSLTITLCEGDLHANDALLDAMASGAYMPALSDLKLHGLGGVLTSLMPFLVWHNHTLRRLALTGLPLTTTTRAILEANIRQSAGDANFELSLDELRV